MGKTIKLDSKGRFSLKDIEDLIDTTKIEFYAVKLKKDKTIVLKFYDKKRKLVKPNVQK